MKKYISLLLLPFIVACEKKIDVKLPEYQEQLFFYSDVETGSHFNAYVRRSEKITNYNNLRDLSVKNAVVQLYINDKDATPVYYVDSVERYAFPVTLKPNDRIKILVTAPGYPEATSEAVVPSAVPIESLVFHKSARIDEFGNAISDIRIKFTDPPTAGDYYMVDLITSASLYYLNDTLNLNGDWICVKSNDPSIDEVTISDPFASGEDECLPWQGIMLNDMLFNGQTKELVLSANDYYFEPLLDSNSSVIFYPRIKLKHISAEYYKYLKTTKNVYDNSGNPFAEPVNVISNVKNGYGVLAPVSVSVKEIKKP